jgi:phosphatidylinositol-3-phosphatase
MLKKSWVWAAALSGALWSWPTLAAAVWPAGLPVYDHIVIVLEENKDYEQIIPNKDAAFINELASEGALFTSMFGEEHNSEGNYFWLFSGSNQNVGFRDDIPKEKLTTSNLGQQLIIAKRSFKGYAEDLPAIGAEDEFAPAPCGRNCAYARKHVPWVSFDNLPNGKTADSSSSLRFLDFPSDFSKLPTVSFVVPNQFNDMHSGDPGSLIETGDRWLRDHMQDYYHWAKDHNSLLIVTFDENNNTSNFSGLTDPASTDRVVKNRIATVFAGARVKAGTYPEGNGITHVNILRTIEAMYGLARSGAQQEHAAKAGISDDFIITDVFATQ